MEETNGQFTLVEKVKSFLGVKKSSTIEFRSVTFKN